MRVLLISNETFSTNDPVFAELETRGVVFHRIALKALRTDPSAKPLRKLRQYFPDAKVIHAIEHAYGAFRPDIVHINIGRPVALAALRALKPYDVPMLLNHGAVDGLNVLNPFDWVTYFNRRIGTIIVPSFAMLNNWMGRPLLRHAIGVDRCTVLHHPVGLPEQAGSDERQALRERLGFQNDEFVIGTVCKVRPIKNLPFIAAVVKALGAPYVLGVIGSAEDGRETGRILEAGGGRVKLLGHIADAARSTLAFDLYVSPTMVPGEAFGLGAAEAQAAGVPVLTSIAGGTSEIIEDGASGMALPLSGPAWEEAIRTLAADRERLAAMGAAGRARIAERFSASAIADALCYIYRRSIRAG